MSITSGIVYCLGLPSGPFGGMKVNEPLGFSVVLNGRPLCSVSQMKTVSHCLSRISKVSFFENASSALPSSLAAGFAGSDLGRADLPPSSLAALSLASPFGASSLAGASLGSSWEARGSAATEPGRGGGGGGTGTVESAHAGSASPPRASVQPMLRSSQRRPRSTQNRRMPTPRLGLRDPPPHFSRLARP